MRHSKLLPHPYAVHGGICCAADSISESPPGIHTADTEFAWHEGTELWPDVAIADVSSIESSALWCCGGFGLRVRTEACTVFSTPSAWRTAASRYLSDWPWVQQCSEQRQCPWGSHVPVLLHLQDPASASLTYRVHAKYCILTSRGSAPVHQANVQLLYLQSIGPMQFALHAAVITHDHP